MKTHEWDNLLYDCLVEAVEPGGEHAARFVLATKLAELEARLEKAERSHTPAALGKGES